MNIKDWKEYWLERQKDQSHKRETRQEKKKVRRQFHKGKRKQARERLRMWGEDYDYEID